MLAGKLLSKIGSFRNTPPSVEQRLSEQVNTLVSALNVNATNTEKEIPQVHVNIREAHKISSSSTVNQYMSSFEGSHVILLFKNSIYKFAIDSYLISVPTDKKKTSKEEIIKESIKQAIKTVSMSKEFDTIEISQKHASIAQNILTELGIKSVPPSPNYTKKSKELRKLSKKPLDSPSYKAFNNYSEAVKDMLKLVTYNKQELYSHTSTKLYYESTRFDWKDALNNPTPTETGTNSNANNVNLQKLMDKGKLSITKDQGVLQLTLEPGITSKKDLERVKEVLDIGTFVLDSKTKQQRYSLIGLNHINLGPSWNDARELITHMTVWEDCLRNNISTVLTDKITHSKDSTMHKKLSLSKQEIQNITSDVTFQDETYKDTDLKPPHTNKWTVRKEFFNVEHLLQTIPETPLSVYNTLNSERDSNIEQATETLSPFYKWKKENLSMIPDLKEEQQKLLDRIETLDNQCSSVTQVKGIKDVDLLLVKHRIGNISSSYLTPLAQNLITDPDTSSTLKGLEKLENYFQKHKEPFVQNRVDITKEKHKQVLDSIDQFYTV